MKSLETTSQFDLKEAVYPASKLHEIPAAKYVPIDSIRASKSFGVTKDKFETGPSPDKYKVKRAMSQPNVERSETKIPSSSHRVDKPNRRRRPRRRRRSKERRKTRERSKERKGGRGGRYRERNRSRSKERRESQRHRAHLGRSSSIKARINTDHKHISTATPNKSAKEWADRLKMYLATPRHRYARKRGTVEKDRMSKKSVKGGTVSASTKKRLSSEANDVFGNPRLGDDDINDFVDNDVIKITPSDLTSIFPQDQRKDAESDNNEKNCDSAVVQRQDSTKEEPRVMEGKYSDDAEQGIEEKQPSPPPPPPPMPQDHMERPQAAPAGAAHGPAFGIATPPRDMLPSYIVFNDENRGEQNERQMTPLPFLAKGGGGSSHAKETTAPPSKSSPFKFRARPSRRGPHGMRNALSKLNSKFRGQNRRSRSREPAGHSEGKTQSQDDTIEGKIQDTPSADNHLQELPVISNI